MSTSNNARTQNISSYNGGFERASMSNINSNFNSGLGLGNLSAGASLGTLNQNKFDPINSVSSMAHSASVLTPDSSEMQNRSNNLFNNSSPALNAEKGGSGCKSSSKSLADLAKLENRGGIISSTASLSGLAQRSSTLSGSKNTQQPSLSTLSQNSTSPLNRFNPLPMNSSNGKPSLASLSQTSHSIANRDTGRYSNTSLSSLASNPQHSSSFMSLSNASNVQNSSSSLSALASQQIHSNPLASANTGSPNISLKPTSLSSLATQQSYPSVNSISHVQNQNSNIFSSHQGFSASLSSSANSNKGENFGSLRLNSLTSQNPISNNLQSLSNNERTNSTGYTNENSLNRYKVNSGSTCLNQSLSLADFANTTANSTGFLSNMTATQRNSHQDGLSSINSNAQIALNSLSSHMSSNTDKWEPQLTVSPKLSDSSVKPSPLSSLEIPSSQEITDDYGLKDILSSMDSLSIEKSEKNTLDSVSKSNTFIRSIECPSKIKFPSISTIPNHPLFAPPSFVAHFLFQEMPDNLYHIPDFNPTDLTLVEPKNKKFDFSKPSPDDIVTQAQSKKGSTTSKSLVN